ncbi:MAG: hypothetical protein ACXVCJ_28985 [Polyangiales bacterium]
MGAIGGTFREEIVKLVAGDGGGAVWAALARFTEFVDDAFEVVWRR